MLLSNLIDISKKSNQSGDGCKEKKTTACRNKHGERLVNITL